MLERIQSVTVSEAAAWWRGEMAFAVPRILRRQFGFGQAPVRLLVDGERVAVSGDDGSEAETIVADADGRLRTDRSARRVKAALRAADRQAEILLSEDRMLTTTLTVSSSDLANIDRVIRSRMDRITPFKAEDVLFDYRIVSSDVERKTIRLDVFVATQREVNDAVDRARALGAKVTRVGCVASNASVNLLPKDQLPQGRNLLVTLNRLLATLLVVCLVAVIAVELLAKRDRLAASDRRVAELRSEAMAAVEIEEKIEALRASVARRVNAGGGSGSALTVLSEVTGLLPDDTWLDELILEDGRLVIAGYSGSISGILESLQSSEMISGARLAAPVAPDPGGRGDRFRIEATLIQPDGVTE